MFHKEIRKYRYEIQKLNQYHASFSFTLHYLIMIIILGIVKCLCISTIHVITTVIYILLIIDYQTITIGNIDVKMMQNVVLDVFILMSITNIKGSFTR